jgi:dipeptidyl aminopeptidase/acylaminoacyl peptidase
MSNLLPRLAILLLAAAPALAQGPAPRPLSHDDYDSWPSLQGTTPSPDGAWLAYQLGPQQGDGVLEVRQVDGEGLHRFPRGEMARFTADARFLVFRVGASKDAQREERIAKLREAIQAGEGKFTEPKKDPDASLVELCILDLKSGEVLRIPRVESFQLGAETGFVCYVPKPDKEQDKDEKAEKAESGAAEAEGGAGAAEPAAGPRGPGRGRRRGAGGDAPDEDDDKAEKGFQARDGKPLVIRELATGAEQKLEWVMSHRFVADDRFVLFDVQKKPAAPKKKAPEATAPKATASAKEGAEAGEPATEAEPAAAQPEAAAPKAEEPSPVEPAVEQGLFALELATGRKVRLLEGPANYGGFVGDRDDRRLALWTDLADKDAKQPEIAIHVWDLSGGPAELLIGADHAAIPAGKRLSKSGLGFSRDGSVLTFTVEDDPAAPLPPVLAEDKVVLDLWHWQDGLIQPMQAKGRGGDDGRWSAVCFLDERRVVVLGDEALPTMRLCTDDGSRALATDSRPYEALVSWDGRYTDVYIVNTIDGSRRKVLEGLRGSPSSSPTGRFLTWFDDRQWHVLDLSTAEQRTLTARLEVAFWQEDDDTPDPASPYGVAGWVDGDRAVVLYDRYDLWKVDPQSGEATCVTDGYGRANQLVLRRVAIDLAGEGEGEGEENEDDRWLQPALLLSALDQQTKASGYYTDSLVEVGRPKRLVMKDARFGALRKPKRAERLFYTLESYDRFPDVWTADLAFGGERRLTDANPKLREVRWGRAELVRWKSADGIALQGKLVVPDGFDPAKRYPMLVYFYEKLSDGLHRHVTPQPGTSPNAAFYVSNGYLWFEPDIVYREGYPGESALKCIVPGVQSLIARGFVDEGAIGIAGHSWGGYQTAYLVTKTNLFAAAESGAPVSNMVSAYGGIRWGTGMSRQFQYEQTQSRIGGTPWTYPLRFLENSPIFFADKVETPVLMLHNDQDGAVPWYQGIEYFMALRRLGKEAYLFNYVGEDHGLRKRQNQRDWTRRMQEFFDHHLKGMPAPAWMVEGVRFQDRDKEKIRFAPSYIEATAAPAAEAAEALEAGIGAGTQGGD